MWHNHKNHIGSPCRSVFDFLPNQCKNRKPHRSPKSEKPLYFCQKTEKPDGTKQKNRKPQRTTKPRKRSFSMQKPKNRPTKWPKLKNRKSQRPPPLPKNQWSFLCFLPFVFQSCFVPTSDYSLVLRHPRFLRVLTSKMSLYIEKCIS